MKIFVAIPGYDGKLHFEVVRSLLAEQAIAIGIGDEISFNYLVGNAGIVQGRNQLATEFMDSGFDRLFFLDSDVTFEPGALIKLAHKPADFVGGAYRYKHGEEKYPVAWLNHDLWADEHGLLEVEGVPTGFLSLSRRVFQTMLDRHPERGLTQQCGYKAYCFFQMPFKDGHLYGEDFFFCREWLESGGKIYLDPEIRLTHWNFNPVPHVGHIGNWLKNRPTSGSDQCQRLET
jgi:hypothetical protein